jgi:hypothetical protein
MNLFLRMEDTVFISVCITANTLIRYLGDDQVTGQVFRNPELEIPENLYFLKKIGVSSPN